MTAYARNYTIGGTDLSINIDDNRWYVFTRDNLRNNTELNKFGKSYDSMYKFLTENSAYMDAILLYEGGAYVELFIRKSSVDTGPANLSNYSDDFVLTVAKGLAERHGSEDYSVYTNQYNFARLDYVDPNYDYHICEFFTTVNKENYTLTFQSPSQFTDWEYEEFERIVDSIRFNIDPAIKEEKTNSFLDNIITHTIGGAVLGGIGGVIILLLDKKKRKRSKNKDISPTDCTETN